MKMQQEIQEQKLNEQNKWMNLTLYFCTVTTDWRGHIDGIFYGTFSFVGGTILRVLEVAPWSWSKRGNSEYWYSEISQVHWNVDNTRPLSCKYSTSQASHITGRYGESLWGNRTGSHQEQRHESPLTPQRCSSTLEKCHFLKCIIVQNRNPRWHFSNHFVRTQHWISHVSNVRLKRGYSSGSSNRVKLNDRPSSSLNARSKIKNNWKSISNIKRHDLCSEVLNATTLQVLNRSQSQVPAEQQLQHISNTTLDCLSQ